jgi:hypothetical protein
MIRRPGALQLAEHELAGLTDRREAAAAALREAIATGGGNDQSAADARVTAINATLQGLDRQMAAATAARNKARLPYAGAVASALAPTERAATDEACAAIDDLVAALRTLDLAAREVQKAGGVISWRFPDVYRSAISALKLRLRARE